MPRKPITREARIREVDALLPQLRAAVKEAKAAESDATAEWAKVSDLAGRLQRRTRQLGGLSRGG